MDKAKFLVARFIVLSLILGLGHNAYARPFRASVDLKEPEGKKEKKKELKKKNKKGAKKKTV